MKSVYILKLIKSQNKKKGEKELRILQLQKEIGCYKKLEKQEDIINCSYEGDYQNRPLILNIN